MTRSARDLLEDLRVVRGFRADEVLDAKVGRLTRWFCEQRLDAAVVGVSGGIDSAVTLGLLQRVTGAPGSPLRRVIALLVPIDEPGATGQDRATQRARLVTATFGVETWEAPFAEAHRAAVGSLEEASGRTFDAWSAGQLLSVLRTPALYGAVALLQAGGERPVVVGTTNRDEGAYLGFFGKASDGAVDLQPISDLHKSEVRALGAILGVPDAVMRAAPTGDVWDGRTDAEMIGADYDDVELVLRLRELGLDPSSVVGALDEGRRLADAAAAIERLHEHNAHKYAVGSPAVHLDVLPRGVPGGWSDEVLSPRSHPPPTGGLGPGEWRPPAVDLDAHEAIPDREVLAPGAALGRGVLTGADCRRLIRAMDDHAHPVPVGVTGVRSSAGIGSRRATAWSPDLAAALWARLAPIVTAVRFLDPRTPTDGHATDERAGHRTWRVVGLSPVLRFMRYEPGGCHLCHYDAGYDYGDGRRTLASVVFYLTDAPPGRGGATRLIHDGQGALPVWERDHRDWSRATRADEVAVAVRPEQGAALVFDHRIAHDVERWSGPGPRVVIRGDVIYEAVPDGRSLP